MTNWRNMPGPGDPETWPPYSGNPNDPRAPDDDGVYEAAEQNLIEEKGKDIGWFGEALAEMSDENCKALHAAYLADDTDKLGALLKEAVVEYLTPTEGDVWDYIKDQRDDYEPY